MPKPRKYRRQVKRSIYEPVHDAATLLGYVRRVEADYHAISRMCDKLEAALVNLPVAGVGVRIRENQQSRYITAAIDLSMREILTRAHGAGPKWVAALLDDNMQLRMLCQKSGEQLGAYVGAKLADCLRQHLPTLHSAMMRNAKTQAAVSRVERWADPAMHLPIIDPVNDTLDRMPLG